MLTECWETKSAWETTKKLHKEIADVVHASFKHTGTIEDLSRKSLTFFIRDENGRVVCAAYGTPLTEKEIFLSFITTKIESRNKGYCTKLLKAIYQGQPMNFTRIILNADKNDEAVLNFYRNRYFF